MVTSNDFLVNIAIIGVGSTGCKIANNISANNKNIKTVYIDTNNKTLENYDPSETIYLNKNKNFSSLESENDLIEYKKLAINSIELIKEKLKDVEILILTGGLGGSTSSAILPIIAKVAKEMKIITISIVSTPFFYEGTTKELNSRKSLFELEEMSDVTIVISNNKIIKNYPDITINDIFQLVDKVLINCITCFINLFSNNLIDISKIDLLNSIKNKGQSYIGFGSGIGKNKITKAIDQSLNSKLIDIQNKKSANYILVLVGDSTITINEIHDLIKEFKSKIKNEKANIIFSFKNDPSLINEIKISVISTYSKKQEFKSIFPNDDILQSSQELLLEVGNFADTITNNYNYKELDLSSYSRNKLTNNSINIDDKVQENDIIVSDEKKDDDIPFFLK